MYDPANEFRRNYLPRTRVSRLSSDVPQARELQILYDTQLPQVDVRCDGGRRGVFVETSRADFNELFEALGLEW